MRREKKSEPEPRKPNQPQELGPPPGWDKEYAAFRLKLIQRIFAENLKPVEVAKILEDASNHYQQITYEECRRLRDMGEAWEPWQKPRSWGPL